VLRGRWRNIIVVNVHAPSEKKTDEPKDSFYEELEQVFDHFPKYHMKMLLGDFKMSLTETYSRVRVGDNVSGRFPIRNGLKHVDALSPLLFNFALE